MREYTTENLVLRAVTRDDLAEVARTWELKGPVALEEAESAISWMEENHRLNRPRHIHHICLAVFEEGGSDIIGWCGLDGTNGKTIEIFYMINSEHRKKGYATECAKKLLEIGFSEMEAERIDGGCAIGNIASRRVLEKIGMTRTGDKDDGSPHFYMTRGYLESVSDPVNSVNITHS